MRAAIDACADLEIVRDDALLNAVRVGLGRSDLNGIQMRRVYFQLDNDLSVRFSTRADPPMRM